MADITLDYELSADETYYIVTGPQAGSEGDTVNIPKTYEETPVTEIKAEAFKGQTNIKNVIIPDGITSIGNYAFHGCTSLASVAIPDSVTSIGNHAFHDCTGLTSVTIPDSVTSIGSCAFYGCSSLTSVALGDSVLSIGYEVFANCTLLTSITIPGSARSIDEGAFSGCSSLESITIPSSVASIGNNAFYGCLGLRFVVIPETVIYFGTTIFNNCNSSAKFYFPYNDTTKVLDIGTGGTKLYYYPNRPHSDMDFLGFTFNGKHSYFDLGVLRTISDRMQHSLSPDMNDITADNPGGDGTYYFGSHHKSRKFSIDFAFDHLTEQQMREWKKFCSNKELSDLIFDEEPYKVYTAKITGSPVLKTIAFDEDGQRIYKGEGTLEFTCYWPYAHTPNPDTKVSTVFISDGRFWGDGKELINYHPKMYPTKSQWSSASGIGTHTPGNNLGDIPAPFVLLKGSYTPINTTVVVGNLAITVLNEAHVLKWDSKTGIVSGTDSSGNEATRKPISYSGESLGGIPVTSSPVNWGIRTGQGTTDNPYQYDHTNCSLTYHYWYY